MCLKFKDLGLGGLGLKWLPYMFEIQLTQGLGLQHLWISWLQAEITGLCSILLTSLAGLLKRILMVKADEKEQEYMLVLYKP